MRGEPGALADWLAAAGQGFVPGRLVFGIPSQATGLPPALDARTAPPGTVRAWVCRGHTCQEPANGLPELRAQLAAG